MNRLARKKFEFKKCGEFTLESGTAEYKRSLHERARIANLRSSDLSKKPSNGAPAAATDRKGDTELASKPSAKSWSRGDYAIKLAVGVISKDVNPFEPLPGGPACNQFARTQRCGDHHSSESSIDTYRDSVQTARANKSKLSGSAAREIITSDGVSASAEPTSPKPTQMESWNVDAYRVRVVQNNDNKPAPFVNSQEKYFQRNNKCGDGFSVDSMQKSFRLAKIEAKAIRQRTNGGSGARDTLTQKGRVD
jgi:hypothetical protein